MALDASGSAHSTLVPARLATCTRRAALRRAVAAGSAVGAFVVARAAVSARRTRGAVDRHTARERSSITCGAAVSADLLACTEAGRTFKAVVGLRHRGILASGAVLAARGVDHVLAGGTIATLRPISRAQLTGGALNAACLPGRDVVTAYVAELTGPWGHRRVLVPANCAGFTHVRAAFNAGAGLAVDRRKRARGSGRVGRVRRR